MINIIELERFLEEQNIHIKFKDNEDIDVFKDSYEQNIEIFHVYYDDDINLIQDNYDDLNYNIISNYFNAIINFNITKFKYDDGKVQIEIEGEDAQKLGMEILKKIIVS